MEGRPRRKTFDEVLMGRVQGKVALVSGAASGLGAATAALLAREGAAVVLADIDAGLAGQVLERIRAAGGVASFVALDVAREEDWVAAMAQVRERHGGLHVAVNCAGINVPRYPPEATPLEDWRKLMAVNLDGVFLGTQHALRLMQETQPVNGSIINISSVMGLVAQGDLGAYVASKGGVRLYSKSVALSCAERGIRVRVNTIHPGFIDTPLVQRAMQRFADPAEGRRVYDALQPMGHLGEPDDIAYGALYLASDESRFVTGSELVIDGGFTAR